MGLGQIRIRAAGHGVADGRARRRALFARRHQRRVGHAGLRGDGQDGPPGLPPAGRALPRTGTAPHQDGRPRRPHLRRPLRRRPAPQSTSSTVDPNIDTHTHR